MSFYQGAIFLYYAGRMEQVQGRFENVSKESFLLVQVVYQTLNQLSEYSVAS